MHGWLSCNYVTEVNSHTVACLHLSCVWQTDSNLTRFPRLHALGNFIYRRRINDMYNQKVSLSYNAFLVHIVTWHCSIFVIFLQYLLHCKCCNYVIRNKAGVYYCNIRQNTDGHHDPLKIYWMPSSLAAVTLPSFKEEPASVNPGKTSKSFNLN